MIFLTWFSGCISWYQSCTLNAPLLWCKKINWSNVLISTYLSILVFIEYNMTENRCILSIAHGFIQYLGNHALYFLLSIELIKKAFVSHSLWSRFSWNYIYHHVSTIISGKLKAFLRNNSLILGRQKNKVLIILALLKKWKKIDIEVNTNAYIF